MKKFLKTEFYPNHLITSINFHYSSANNNSKSISSRQNINRTDENKENKNINSNISIVNQNKYSKLKKALQRQPIKKKLLNNNFEINQKIINLNSYKSVPLKIFEPGSFNNTSIHYTKYKNKENFTNKLVNINKNKRIEHKRKINLNKEKRKENQNFMILNSSVSFSKIKNNNSRKLPIENSFQINSKINNSIENESISYKNNILFNLNLSSLKYGTAAKNIKSNSKLDTYINNPRKPFQNFFSPPKLELSNRIREPMELQKSCRILSERRSFESRLKYVNPDDFKIIKQIGFGSFGKIYKTLNIKNGQKYALKVMHNNKDNISYMQEKVRLIMDFQKRIKCDGLIKIYGDACIRKGNQYYYYEVLELADKDWEQEIISRGKQHKFYSEYDLINIMCGLIETLSLLQKNHITHRDIKLQNILLLNNSYKICDFGEARKLCQKGVIVQPVRGSELYMSPIQFFGLDKKLDYVQHNTYKSDVFSLGMCILFAATLSDDCLYEIRELTNMIEIERILMKYLRRRYSIKFIHFLLILLEIDEKNRPDFITLEQIILNIFDIEK